MRSIRALELEKRRYGTRIPVIAIGVILLITAALPRCQAQTWNEIFRQKKTQIKYLGEQIAALQVYLGYARKGYQLVGSGLEVVRDITSGEFNLHHAFISGLKQVSPAVRGDARVAEIVALQAAILKSFSGIKGDSLLGADQAIYVADVAEGVISDCLGDMEELLLVITSGKLEISDDERLVRLNGIYERMLDKSGFTRSFCSEARLLIRQKRMEGLTLERLRRYYEIE